MASAEASQEKYSPEARRLREFVRYNEPAGPLSTLVIIPVAFYPVFGAVTILLSLCISLAASELVLRRIVEGSWTAVFSGFVDGVP